MAVDRHEVRAVVTPAMREPTSLERSRPEAFRGLVVGAALVDVAGRVLVARRSAPPELAGLWEFPGGKVEPGEAPDAALRRELAEELGVGVRLDAPLPGPVADERTPAGAWPLSGWVMAVWLGTVTDGVPVALADHEALTWIGPADVDTLAWVPADRPVADAVFAVLR